MDNVVLRKLFGEHTATVSVMAAFFFSISTSVGVTYMVFQCPENGPAVVPPIPDPLAKDTGKILIDVNPWGRVEWIRSKAGNPVDLPADNTTPFLMNLPVGQYEAQVENPGGKAKRCDLQVRKDQLARCWLDLAPVDAKSYFQRIGW